MLSDAREVLQRVLNPVSYDDFFNSYVGKKPLIIKDNNPFRAAIGGTSPREKLLRGHRRYAPAVTCHSHAITGQCRRILEPSGCTGSGASR